MSSQKIWLLNTSWGAQDLSNLFIERGFWEPEPSSYVRKSDLRKIENGDEVHLVVISQASCRTTKAVGIVKGINFKINRIIIRWLETKLPERRLHRGGAGTIIGSITKTVTSDSTNRKKAQRRNM